MKKYAERALVAAITIAVLVVGAAAYAWSGLYDIGADAPHWKTTYALLETLRDRSIHARAENLAAPDLDDPQLILKGAGQYAAMCTGCHLAPGMHDSEIRPGLYPQPPDLAQQRVDPKVAFWVIKHGIKMSAMPAWGSSHDDATIWSMVAFLQKLPGMTPAGYKAIVAKAPPDDDMDMDDHHDHADGDMGGMPMPAGAATSAAPASMSKPAQ
jgi:mono/diheme cytochrome c family protein